MYKLGWVVPAFNPAFRKLRQETFMNSRPACAMTVKPNLKNTKKELVMVAHAEDRWFQGQPDLHREALFQ